MPKRDVRLYLTDMLDAISKIQRYTSNISFEDFEQNDMLIDAVVRNLEIIGEAVKQIPEDLRSKFSEIDWHRVIGFRNIVIHEYFDVDVNIVWVIATERLNELKNVLEKMLQYANKLGN